MTPYQAATEKVASSFKTPVSTKWVVTTGRRDLVNGILDAMSSARSQSEFDSLAYEFKRQVLIPYFRDVVQPLSPQEQDLFIRRNPLINMNPRKALGGYDELKRNPVFAESQFKGRAPGDTALTPQLGRIAQDPAELSLAARGLQMTPEALRDYIQEQFNERARKQFQRDYREAAASGQAYRDSLARQYEESMPGTILGVLSPEVTAYQLEAIRRGEEDSWKLAKAIAKDALVGVGSLFTGGAAGRMTAKPAMQALLGGAIDAGIEAGRQAASDYYDFDPANIAATGTTSATMPSIIGATAGLLGGIPGARRIINPIQRKLKGMLPDPAEEEMLRAKSIQKRAEEATAAAYEGGDMLAREGADDLLADAKQFMENSPQRVFEPTPLTTERVRDIVMDPDLASRYFEPPTRENFLDMIVRRNTGGPEDIVNIGGTQKYASDVAEEWIGKAKTQWPETYKKMSTPEPPKTMLDKIGESLVDIGSRGETARRRSQGSKSVPTAPSRALEELMTTDPELIKMWQAGFAPRGNDALVKLYEEWKSKFGG